MLVYDGHGDSLCTAKDYGDFELWVDWKIEPKGDSGIYLRGSPRCRSGDLGREQADDMAPAACSTTRSRRTRTTRSC